jgi:hypothetical protein
VPFLPSGKQKVAWFVAFCLGTIAFGTSVARADGDICDPLYSLESGGHTVWDFFSHPCPPEPDETEPALPGIGVTLLGIRPFPVLSNPIGFSSSPGRLLLQDQVENGFGGALEINGWLSANLGLRLEIGMMDFPGQPGQSSFDLLPVTLGVEVRLLGDTRTFVYMAADGGVAVNGQNAQNVFVGTSGSPYIQAGIGLNLWMLQLEADYAAILQPLGAFRNANPFFFVPVSLGVHL